MTKPISQITEQEYDAKILEASNKASFEELNTEILNSKAANREIDKDQEIAKLEQSNLEIQAIIDNPDSVVQKLRAVKVQSILDSFIFLPPANPESKMEELMAEFDNEIAQRVDTYIPLYQKQIEMQKHLIEELKS